MCIRDRIIYEPSQEMLVLSTPFGGAHYQCLLAKHTRDLALGIRNPDEDVFLVAGDLPLLSKEPDREPESMIDKLFAIWPIAPLLKLSGQSPRRDESDPIPALICQPIEQQAFMDCFADLFESSDGDRPDIDEMIYNDWKQATTDHPDLVTIEHLDREEIIASELRELARANGQARPRKRLSLIHISEPTRQAEISYAVFC